jgi:hypothetical protein
VEELSWASSHADQTIRLAFDQLLDETLVAARHACSRSRAWRGVQPGRRGTAATFLLRLFSTPGFAEDEEQGRGDCCSSSTAGV